MLSSAAPRISAGPRCTICAQQVRHATLIRRPKRPYTFTQLITLSDGSTFLHRTTSPQPIYKTTKDTKNTALWNPSSQKLLNVEEDEAGKLRRFRQRFGRGFDVDAADAEGADEAGEYEEDGDQSMLDLIAGTGTQKEAKGKDEAPGGGKREDKKRSGKGKGGEK